jgi:sulfur-oxidizing protein SoxA
MRVVCLALLLVVLSAVHAAGSPESERQALLDYFKLRFPQTPLEQYVHGALMLSPDARAQYDAIMEFPPFQAELDRGKALWERPFRNGKTLADCFPDRGRNVAGNYPHFDARLGRVVTFEMAINFCLRDNGEAQLDFNDRQTMGVLTSYARTLSDGMPMNIRVESEGAREKFEAGRRLYYRRLGQMNIACASCHVTHAGRYFRDELISPVIGQAVHFPVFRGGEHLYTLQMRYQRCMEAVRAVPFSSGSEELNNLEYFHSYLSNGLPLSASVYRK